MKISLKDLFNKAEFVGRGCLISGSITAFIGKIKDQEMLTNIGIGTGVIGAITDITAVVGAACLKKFEEDAALFEDGFEDEFVDDDDDLFMEDEQEPSKIVGMPQVHVAEDSEDPEASKNTETEE